MKQASKQNTPCKNIYRHVIFGAINSAATISDKLKITGVKAGKENFWWVFWIPPAKATNDIKAKYGNIILKTWTEISCFIGSKYKPGANKKINIGAKVKTTNVKINRVNIRVPVIAFKNSLVCKSSFFSSYSAYKGIKAWLKAPSAKKRRKRFGILRQITKISWKTDAPNKLVVEISLISPKNLETLVPETTFFKLLKNPLFVLKLLIILLKI